LSKFDHDSAPFLTPVVSIKRFILTDSYLSSFDSNISRRNQKFTSYCKYRILPKLKCLLFFKVKFICNDSVVVTDEFTYNYFHWILDVLPKVSLLRKQGFLCKVLLPAHLKVFNYVEDSLQIMGIKNYLFLDQNKIYLIKKTYYFLSSSNKCNFFK
jgi:hypothetical protein